MSLLRLLGRLLPLVSASSLRLSQLGVLVAIAQLSPGRRGDALVLGVGTLTAMAILSDVGASNYLLTRGRRIHSREFYSSCAAQLLVGVVGGGVALLVVLASSGEFLRWADWVTLGTIGLSQVLDSSLRAVRAPLLSDLQDAAYALPELCLGVVKIALVATAVAVEAVIPLWVLPLVSITVLALSAARVRRRLSPARDNSLDVFHAVLPFAVAGAVSALYSQSAILVSSAFLATANAAVIVVALRVSQPAELIPGTASTQLLPRLAADPLRWRRFYWIFVTGGTFVSVTLVFLEPLIRWAIPTTSWNRWVYYAACVVLIPKFGNYLLGSAVSASGLIWQRVRASSAAALVCVSMSLVGAASNSWEVIMAAMLVAECVLALALIRALRSNGRVATECPHQQGAPV